MKKHTTRVKISNIAQLAGVSAGTVDRVIHNRGEVAKETREKILKIIREINYEPDILARTLASRKTKRFIALVPKASNVNPFWKTPVQGLNAGWEEVKHFGVVLENFYFDFYNKKSFVEQLEKIIEYKPDGIILAPVFFEKSIYYVNIFNELNIPVVFINSNIENENKLSFVGQDTWKSGMVAARLLDYSLDESAAINIINIINDKSSNTHVISREEGFREYFKNKNKSDFKQLITLNIKDQNYDKINKILHKHFDQVSTNQRATGIFVTNSRVFLVADYLKKRNLKNVRLAGYDLIEQNINHLRNDTIDFLISQKPYEQGYRSLITLFKKVVMQKEVEANQFLPIDIITKENLDFYLNS